MEKGAAMSKLGLETTVVDRQVYDATVERFRAARLRLPTFAQLAEPATIPPAVQAALADVDRDEADGLNLFRVHWYNGPRDFGEELGGAGGGGNGAEVLAVPQHVVLPQALTGVEARIVVVFADSFPMIHAHKVLATYGCLAPRIVTGQFDPGRQKAIWPSTGNYCRGGVAVSRIMGCRGVAVLPAGMSRERFAWLESWVEGPEDIIRTVGSESNVKEIYDRCAELERDAGNVIFNQFSEFGNHLAHYFCTGRAMDTVFGSLAEAEPGLRLRAFTSATGSAGTLGGGGVPEGSARLPGRRGRGPRVPDAALQRLRRAQHPGHRGQARAPHPQRHEHGRRDRGVGSRHGRVVRSPQQSVPDGSIWPASAASRRRCWTSSAGSGSRRSATCWPRSSLPRSSGSARATW